MLKVLDLETQAHVLGTVAELARMRLWIRAVPCGHTKRVRSLTECLLSAHPFLHSLFCTSPPALIAAHPFLHSLFCASRDALPFLQMTSCTHFSAHHFKHSLCGTSLQALTFLHLLSAKCCFEASRCMHNSVLFLVKYPPRGRLCAALDFVLPPLPHGGASPSARAIGV